MFHMIENPMHFISNSKKANAWYYWISSSDVSFDTTMIKVRYKMTSIIIHYLIVIGEQ